MRYVIALTILPLFSYAQSSIEQLTIDQGLSQNFIYDLIQDRRGFMWFGTKEGLNRYDGYSFVIYRNDPMDTASLSGNNVTALYEDSLSVLWVGTAEGVLNRFDRATERFTHFAFEDVPAAGMKADHITSISPGSGGILWIGLMGSGLISFDTRRGGFKRIGSDSSSANTLPSPYTFDAVEDSIGNVWVSTGSGLAKVDGKTLSVTRYLRNIGTEMSRDFDKLTTVTKDNSGRIWICHRKGIDIFDGSTFKNIFAANDSNRLFWPARIRLDNDGNLWSATSTQLVKIDAASLRCQIVTALKKEHFTRALWVDQSDVVWAGTSGLGVSVIRPRAERFGKREGNFLSELFQDEAQRINDYFRERGIPYEVDFKLRGGTLHSVIQDKSAVTWFLTEKGLFRISGKGRGIELIPTNPRTYEKSPSWTTSRVFEDRKNSIWVGTVGGMSELDQKHNTFEYVRLYPDSNLSAHDLNPSSYKDISCIFQDMHGIFWVGTPTLGLIRYDPAVKSVRYFQHHPLDSTSLSSNHVLSIRDDPFLPDSILWVGTDGGGLDRFNTVTERLQNFTVRNGLSNNVIYAILSDSKNFLWMSTNRGIMKFDSRTDEVKSYDVEDGLQSDEFNRNEYYKAQDGTMYFGGIYGYNVFRPETIEDNDVPPRVVITDFKLFNAPVSFQETNSPLAEPITETKHIVLRYDQNMISFQFSALEYSAQKKNKYMYMLEGLDKSWINIGSSRQATFTNISPGNYVFRVKAANGDGIWNEQGASLAITVLPPFWMTWWFRTILVIAFFSAGPIVYYRRVKSLKRETHRQEHISHMLIQGQEQERSRIAQELHDSLGQELLIVKNRALIGLKSEKIDDASREQLDHISSTATKMIKHVREISHNLRPPELDRLGISETLRSILHDVRELDAFNVHGEIEMIDGLISKEDEINVVRILQEGINNILKHSGATAMDVEIKKHGHAVHFRIHDNGRGFDASAPDTSTGLGLAGIAERVQILKGSLKIDSAETKGTTLTISVPIHNPMERHHVR